MPCNEILPPPVYQNVGFLAYHQKGNRYSLYLWLLVAVRKVAKHKNGDYIIFKYCIVFIYMFFLSGAYLKIP